MRLHSDNDVNERSTLGAVYLASSADFRISVPDRVRIALGKKQFFFTTTKSFRH